MTVCAGFPASLPPPLAARVVLLEYTAPGSGRGKEAGAAQKHPGKAGWEQMLVVKPSEPTDTGNPEQTLDSNWLPQRSLCSVNSVWSGPGGAETQPQDLLSGKRDKREGSAAQRAVIHKCRNAPCRGRGVAHRSAGRAMFLHQASPWHWALKCHSDTQQDISPGSQPLGTNERDGQ